MSALLSPESLQQIKRLDLRARMVIRGFLQGLQEEGAEAAPLFAARALPSGTITAETFDELRNRMFAAVEAAGPLDGLLAAPHGATVHAGYKALIVFNAPDRYKPKP